MAAPDPLVLAWAAAATSPGAEVRSVTSLRDGGSPWIVTLSDGAGLFLRIADPADRDELRTEVAALTHLAGHDLPVPRVIATDIEGSVSPGKPAVVLTRMNGSSRLNGPAPPSRLQALGAAAAAVHRVPVPATPSPHLPRRVHTISGIDFATLRRAAAPRRLFIEAERALTSLPPPAGPDVFVHGDMWQGNTMWEGDTLTGMVDWDSAGVGHAGVDLGSLRCDAMLMSGDSAAADEVLAGYEVASGRHAANVVYWDLVGGLCTPPTMEWFVDAIQGQGRTDLSRELLVERRDAWLQRTLDRL